MFLILYFPGFYTLFLHDWPNVHKHNIPCILDHVQVVTVEMKKWGFIVLCSDQTLPGRWGGIHGTFDFLLLTTLKLNYKICIFNK